MLSNKAAVSALTPSSQRSAGERGTVALPVFVHLFYSNFIFIYIKCILCFSSAVHDMSFVYSSVIVGLDWIIVEMLSSPQRSTHSFGCHSNTEVIYSLYLFLLLLFTFKCFFFPLCVGFHQAVLMLK